MKKRDVLKKNGSMNLYLLRVGADSTKLGGGFFSRIYPDRSYIFIPIPNDKNNLDMQKPRPKTYHNYIWNNQSVLNYLPPRIQKAPNQYYVHNDPEFKTFTYGSPKFHKGKKIEKNYNKLAGMKEDDMLAFYAAFTSNGRDIEGYYFFAYFIIGRRAITFCDPDELTKKKKDLVKNNHHFIHGKKRPNQVIVKGHPKKSRVFERAILLSSPKYRKKSNYFPCPFIRDLLGGYKSSMNMSSIRKIPLCKDGIDKFKEYLDDNGGRLRDP